MPSLSKIHEAIHDIVDEGNQLQVKVDVPGVKKTKMDLNVTDNSIELSAKHKEEEDRKNYLRFKRSQISHYRTIPLPEEDESAKTKAKLVDGVLTITLQK